MFLVFSFSWNFFPNITSCICLFTSRIICFIFHWVRVKVRDNPKKKHTHIHTHTHTHTYIYICMYKMFANGPGDQCLIKHRSQVESHQKLKKGFLMPPCLTLKVICCFFLVGERMCLCFMELIQLEVNFWIFNDPRWYLWLLWISFKGMVDSLRIVSIRRPNGLIDFSFWSKYFLYFRSKVQSYAGLDGEGFSLV